MLKSLFLLQSDGKRKSTRKVRENGREVCEGCITVGEYVEQKTYRIKSDDIQLGSHRET